MKKRLLCAIMLVLVLLVLVVPILGSQPVEAACPAPGTGLEGALNMVRSAAMVSDTGPMSKDAPQGNAGMFTAVDNSSCGHP